MDLPIQRLCRTLLVVVLTVVALGAAGEVHRLAVHDPQEPGSGGPIGVLLKQFDLNAEANVPTWVASSLFILAALVAAVTAAASRALRPREVWVWAAVALLFCYLSLDEAAQIHEKTNQLLGRVIDAPGGIDFLSLSLVVVVGGLLLPFVLRLDAPTRRALIWSAALFVTGAAGIEVVTNKLLEIDAASSLALLLVTPVEELLEMLAVIVFIRALLLRLAGGGERLELRFVA